jgi:YbgC/YbaW family acyl-CoA thioester hydrolase
MAKVYTWRFHTRTYELDEQRCISLAALQNYLEEAATQASAANGYDYDWYHANRRLWVARSHALRYFFQPAYRDELEVRTWVSDYRRVQSHREYDVRRTHDDAQVLRARTNWVYVDMDKLRPLRLPDDFFDAFAPDEATMTPLDNIIAAPIAIDSPITRAEERRVCTYEIDAAGHVNNAVYVQWGEQAVAGLLRAVGWTPGRLALEGVYINPVGREIEYLRGAKDGEPLRLETRLLQVGGDRAAFQTEVRALATNDLLCRDIAIRAFADANGPRSIPDALYLALTRRS